MVLLGCATPPDIVLDPIPVPVPPPPPFPRLLTVGLLEKTAAEALQYYISASVTLEYVGIPDYPDEISIKSHKGFREDIVKIPAAPITGRKEKAEQSYRFTLRNPQIVNPTGIASIDYGTLRRIILIPALTGGVLLNSRIDEADGRRVLDIGFEPGNNNTLSFKEDASGEYFYLDPGGNGIEIPYDGHTAYRQLIRERPLLMVRVEENVEFLIHKAEGRVPLAGPRPGRN
jgi:hypothetical protein